MICRESHRRSRVSVDVERASAHRGMAAARLPAASAHPPAQGLSANIRLAPPDVVPDGLGTYDGVILGWGAYSHVVGRPARVELLRALAAHLRPGGPLLFSFQTRPGHPAAQRSFQWIRATARAVRAIRRSGAPLELGDTLPAYFAHRFTQPEIEADAAAAGLAVDDFRELEYGAALARVAMRVS